MDSIETPNRRQVGAVKILRTLDDTSISAWLSLLQSLKPGYEHQSCPTGISSKQLAALEILKECCLGSVLAWLTASRNENYCDSRCLHNGHKLEHHVVGAFARNPQETISGYDYPRTISEQSSAFIGSVADYDTPRNSISQANSLSDLSRQNSTDRGFLTLATIGTHTHAHWCTICEKPPSISTCDGWKRHEKEQHESSYICMPYGHVESESLTPRCALCGHNNPDQEHFSNHGILQCIQKPLGDRSYNRKAQLMKHLQAHDNLDAATLAERWHVTYAKAYYSCGFCVALFTTNADRLNHIDINHWRYHCKIQDWDKNLVIRGLLLQPKVLASWNMHSTHSPREALLSWDPIVATDLQRRLEISQEAPETLAAEAFCGSTAAPDFALGFQPMDFVLNTDLPSATHSLDPPWTNMEPNPLDGDYADVHSTHNWIAQDMANSHHSDHVQPMPVHTDSFAQAIARSQCSLDKRPDIIPSNAHSFSMSFTKTTEANHGTDTNHPQMGSSPPSTEGLSYSTVGFPIHSTPVSHRKSPSIVSQMKRGLSRSKQRESQLVRVREPLPAVETPDAMDFNVDDVMFFMREDEGSRSVVGPRSRASS